MSADIGHMELMLEDIGHIGDLSSGTSKMTHDAYGVTRGGNPVIGS